MNKIKNFFKTLDKKERIIAVLVIIIIVLCAILIGKVTIKSNNNKNQTSTTTNINEEQALQIDDKDEELQEIIKTEENKTKEDTKTSSNNSAKATNDNVKDNSANNSTQVNDNSKSTLKQNEEVKITKNPDEEVVEYFKSVNNDLDSNSKSLKESAKDSFITIVDFMFYDGKIKGYTFKDLSSKAKLSALKLGLSIDSKIDKYFPDYKEKISATTKKTYNNIKNTVVKKYLEVTTNICKKDADTCKQAKQDFSDIKKSFSITWDFIKDLAGTSKDAVKEWYEIYSGK